MTAVEPSIPMPPALRGDTDHGLIEQLSLPVPGGASTSVGSLILVIISLGLLPVLLWPPRWAAFAEVERHDLLALTAWWRKRVDSRRAAELDPLARRLRPRPMLMVLPWLMVGFNVVCLVTLLSQGESLNRIWDLTANHLHATHAARRVETGEYTWRNPGASHFVMYVAPPTPLEEDLYAAWMVSLCIGYLVHWYAVRSHAVTVQSLVRWTNRMARENNLSQVHSEAMRIGLGPVWILMGIAFCTQHAWWIIPLVFAGAMQRRYITRSSPAIRLALANQARDGFAIGQYPGNHFCRQERCGARIPAQARFCPRCGACV